MRLALAGLLLMAPVATAWDGTVVDPPSFTAAELAAGIKPFSDGVLPLTGEIQELEVEETRGDETTVTLNTDILFDFGEATLSATAATRVAEVVDDAPDGSTVSVVGHTDSIGDTGFNQTLSEERAQSVADAIGKARPDLDLEVTGKGESDPVASNTSGGKDDPEGRAQNRRVEVSFRA